MRRLGSELALDVATGASVDRIKDTCEEWKGPHPAVCHHRHHMPREATSIQNKDTCADSCGPVSYPLASQLWGLEVLLDPAVSIYSFCAYFCSTEISESMPI